MMRAAAEHTTPDGNKFKEGLAFIFICHRCVISNCRQVVVALCGGEACVVGCLVWGPQATNEFHKLMF